MRLITDAFGSLKIFAALLTLFVVSRLADLISTYYALEAGKSEGNLSAAITIEGMGFLGFAGLNVGIAILLLVPWTLVLFRELRSSSGEIRAKRGSITLLFWASIYFFVVALWNSGVFYSSEVPLLLSDFTWPLMAVAFGLTSWVVVRIAISLPVTTQART